MKPDAFLRAMGEIREDLVSDAETAGRAIPRWAKVSMAAVIVLCIAGALTMLLGQGVRPYGGQSLTSGSGVEEESSPENNFGISSEILEQAAPTVELTSRYGLTLQVSEELADHFAVDVEDYVFPCAWEDGWPDIEGGQEIIEHAAFVFSDPDNATGESGREGLIWCIQAIPAAEYTPVSNPDSEQDEPFMIYYINSRLLGRSEEYVYMLVFPAPNWQYDPESLESLNAYWRHLYHGYEILQELAERYGWTGSMDLLDDYYERVVCLVDQERVKLTNQQTGVSDRDIDGLELTESVDNGVIELGGIRYKFYMAASPLFTPKYYEITVPSDFRVGKVVGYETDNTYDWYFAEVEPLSGWLIRYMRRNGEDKYSEGELYKAENITAIPQWIEDARKAIMENTGGYPGLEEEYTITPNSAPPFQSSFGLIYDYVEEQPLVEVPVPEGGYTETWTEEQIYEYAGEDLQSKLDAYFGEGRERTTLGDHTVSFYPDGTVSANISFLYVLPNMDEYSPYELLVVVNRDRMDDSVKARYQIGEPNNDLVGTPVWLGWTQTITNQNSDSERLDYTLMAAFEWNDMYIYIRQNTGAEGLFLGTIQTILETYWTVRDNSVLE